MWYRIWRLPIALLICVSLMGLLWSTVGPSLSAAAQEDGCSQDDTFCIGQHPSPTVAAATVASGSSYVRAGLEFEWPGQPIGATEMEHGSLRAMRIQDGWPRFRPIWPGTPDGRRALVTIWLSPSSGSAQVRWPEGSYDLHPGDSITVFATMVELGNFAVADYIDMSFMTPTATLIAMFTPRIVAGDIFGTYTITVDLCD